MMMMMMMMKNKLMKRILVALPATRKQRFGIKRPNYFLIMFKLFLNDFVFTQVSVFPLMNR